MKLVIAIAATMLAACNPQPQFKACDLLQENCRSAIAHATQTLRGSNGPLPAVLVRSEAAVVADSTAQTTAEQRTRFTELNAVLALFDLSTAGLTLAAQTQNHYDNVAAFYSPSTKAVTVIDRGQALDDEQSVLTLAHELVHALQDQDGLLTHATPTTDADLAYTAIIEGEATVYEDLAAFDIYGWDESDIDWDGSFYHYQGVENGDAIRSATPVYDASLDFVYPFGGAYVLQRYRDGKQAAIADIYSDAPSTTYQIGNGASVDSTPPATTAPAGYTVSNSDSLGWWLFSVWCNRELDEPTACDTMLSDSFTYFDGPTPAATWRLHFAAGTDVTSVQSQIPAPYVTAIVDGDLTISRGF